MNPQTEQIDLLIIGAGPYGLSLAALAGHLDIDYLIVGKPMEFWRVNMPKGMYLRSDWQWYLDPTDQHTIDKFLEIKNLTREETEPLSLDFYLDYVDWFQKQSKIDVLPIYVKNLDHIDEDDYRFRATMDDGKVILAKRVVVALGFSSFKYQPEELIDILPTGRFSHTVDMVDFDQLKGKRCLIIGGRQSAFEWAALIVEAGGKMVHVCHRHDTPSFETADWSWIDPMMDEMTVNPSWFRNLSQEEKDDINHRLWIEGRKKLEPWLLPRITNDHVKIWPNANVMSCEVLSSGELEVTLDIDETLTVDHVILATGYKVKIGQIAVLANGNIMDSLETKNNYPVLDENFQTNIPGLYITSLPAAQDFGPFVGFTVASRISAKVIGAALQKSD